MNQKRKDFKLILWNDYDSNLINSDTFEYFINCLHKCNDNEIYGLFLGYQYIRRFNIEKIYS